MIMCQMTCECDVRKKTRRKTNQEFNRVFILTVCVKFGINYNRLSGKFMQMRYDKSTI